MISQTFTEECLGKMSGGGGSMAENLYRTKRFHISGNCFQCTEIILVNRDKCLHMETLQSGKPVKLDLTALPRLCFIGLL